MVRLRSHPELLVVLIALIATAGCAKRPVGYQSAAARSAPAPTTMAPAPEPPSPAASPRSGAPSDVPSPGAGTSTPTSPLAGGQRPSPGDFGPADALKDVYFDFDKHAIRPDAAKTLTANAAWLKANPGTLVLVEGHCDERGTVEYNLALGQRRAQSVRDFLLAQGLPGTRLATISYGKERPSCTESTEECWAQNRRAHFLAKSS